MLASLCNDLIIALGVGDTEIGLIPPGVGIERLRWDGSQLIDLAKVTTIFVRHFTGSHFELHAVPVPNSQPVAMSWADRKRLLIDAGTIRLKTMTEIDAEAKDQKAKAIRARYAARMANLAAPYTPEERETWPIQLVEAEAFAVDPAAPTPMLTPLAQARGISVAHLAAKILHNNNLFRAAAGALLGNQQRELDDLKNS